MRIYEGTSEIQRMIIAGHAMGGYEPVMPPLEDLFLHRDHDPADDEPATGDKTAWRCRMCGHVHYGDTPPEECPYCFFNAQSFKRI